MSGYLITWLKATPNIDVRLRTRGADGHDQARLEALTLEDVRTGQREQVPAAAVFVMIDAEPRTQWLRDLVKLNDRGFILTGRDVPPGAWALPARPGRCETSLAGVFGPAGDVRVRLRQARRRGPRRESVQVRSRFRNLRGSAAGPSLG